MEIMSFTHPEVVPNLYEYTILFVTIQLTVAIELHSCKHTSFFFHTMEANGDQQMLGYPTAANL